MNNSMRKNLVNEDICVRSTEGMIAGICQGVGERVGVNPWAIRAGFIAGVLFFGTGILLYLILAFSFPREDLFLKSREKRFLGVCKRISERTNIELGIIRAITFASGFVSLGITVVAYLAIYFINAEPKNQGIIDIKVD